MEPGEDGPAARQEQERHKQEQEQRNDTIKRILHEEPNIGKDEQETMQKDEDGQDE